jgi:hypothetical protein
MSEQDAQQEETLIRIGRNFSTFSVYGAKVDDGRADDKLLVSSDNEILVQPSVQTEAQKPAWDGEKFIYPSPPPDVELALGEGTGTFSVDGQKLAEIAEGGNVTTFFDKGTQRAGSSAAAEVSDTGDTLVRVSADFKKISLYGVKAELASGGRLLIDTAGGIQGVPPRAEEAQASASSASVKGKLNLTLDQKSRTATVFIKGKKVAEIAPNGNIKSYTDGVQRAELASAPLFNEGDKDRDGWVCIGTSPNDGKPLFVSPADEKELMTLEEAQAAAARWAVWGKEGVRVPTKEELREVFNNKAALGTFKEAVPEVWEAKPQGVIARTLSKALAAVTKIEPTQGKSLVAPAIPATPYLSSTPSIWLGREEADVVLSGTPDGSGRTAKKADKLAVRLVCS